MTRIFTNGRHAADAVTAVLLPIRDAVSGAPATDQERWQRRVAAAREYSRHMLRW